MDEIEFKRRTKAIGLDVIKLVRAMPRDVASDAVARQIVRSATSIGANYRAACRSRSSAEVLSRFAVVEEEADETMYWLEVSRDSGTLSADTVGHLLGETNQIVAMTVASLRTIRSRINPKSRIQNPK